MVIERGVVEPDAGQQLAPLGGVDAAVDDRDLDRLAGAVVGDRDALGHVRRGYRLSTAVSCRACGVTSGSRLVARSVEGGGDLAAGVGRVDHGVDEPRSAAT